MDKILLFTIALCILQCSVATATKYKGLLQVSKKKSIARDITYILDRIFINAKYTNFPDIVDEEGKGMFAKGMYITNIDVIEVQWNYKSLLNKLGFDNEKKRIFLSTTEPLLQYVFAFKWRAKALGANIAYGEGKIKMSSEKLSAEFIIQPDALYDDINVDFKVEVLSLSGENALTPDLRSWVLKNMKEKIKPLLIKGIDYNKHFINEYMYISVANFISRIDKSHTLSFNNIPYDVIEDGDRLLISYRTTLILNGTRISETTLLNEIDTRGFGPDISYIYSPELIPLTVNVHGIAQSCNGPVNMKEFGYSGTVKDLFEAIPRLISLYRGDEKLLMECKYAYRTVVVQPNNVLDLPLQCSINIEETKEQLLSFDSEIRIKYTPKVNAKLSDFYGAHFSEVKLHSLKFKPYSLDINLFLLNFVHSFSQYRYEGKDFEVPRLQFVPWRGYKNMLAEVIQGQYSTFYLEEPDLSSSISEQP